ncbi:MAG: UDPGP type 1 family protein [Planctomycetota bacterium]|nr:MAG: UDPGP type 1 family protein [Planctomycetota bacterium]
MPAPLELTKRLAFTRQEHLVRWWDILSPTQQSQLQHQLESIDFPLIQRLYQARETDAGEAGADRASRATPPSQLVRQPVTPADRELWKRATTWGEQALAAGQVGAILVAGGQGTRLGFDHPKGMFPIGPVSNRTLFQIFCEQLLARGQRAGRTIPYLIMTSDATHAETVAFFEEQQFFGMDRGDVYFFRQGKLPAVDIRDGGILMESQDSVALSPDGHGGLLNALRNEGLLAEMQRRGVEYLYYHQVDNPTAIVCDPAFLGLHLLHNSEMSSKVVAKVSAEEKMGVLVSIDGQTQIIEYSDMPVERTRETEADGQLRFWAGNTAIHVINRSFLQGMIDRGQELPYHRANKPVPYLDSAGESITPTDKNAFKFEQFIFDVLPLATTALVVEADRTIEFNPVKNRSGADSPETSRAALLQAARQMAIDAGVRVAATARLEISPLFVLDAEELQRKRPTSPEISGDAVWPAP